MRQDIERWRKEGNRRAAIEKTEYDMAEVQEAINKIRLEHDEKLRTLDVSDIQPVVTKSNVPIPLLREEPESMPGPGAPINTYISRGSETLVAPAEVEILTRDFSEILTSKSNETGQPKLSTSERELSRAGKDDWTSSMSVLQSQSEDGEGLKPGAEYTQQATVSTTQRSSDAENLATRHQTVEVKHAGIKRPLEFAKVSAELRSSNDIQGRPASIIPESSHQDDPHGKTSDSSNFGTAYSRSENLRTSLEADQGCPVTDGMANAKRRVEEMLMAAFDEWWNQKRLFRVCQSGPEGEAKDSSMYTNTTETSRKGVAQKRKIARDNDDDKLPEDEGGPSPSPGSGRSTQAASLRNFACPYHQRSPGRHRGTRSCNGPGWRMVHRVKEHIYRRHSLPNHCVRCFATFQTQSSLDDHLRQDVPCVKRAESLLPEGFNDAQKQRLKLRPRGSDEDKWRAMYRILFPDDREEDMPSPYVGSISEKDSLNRYDSFIRREMRRRVRRRIEDAVSVELAPLEQEILRTLPDLILEIHREISRDYHATPESSSSSDIQTTSPISFNMDVQKEQLGISAHFSTADDGQVLSDSFGIPDFVATFAPSPGQFSFLEDLDQHCPRPSESLGFFNFGEEQCLLCTLDGNVKGKGVCPHV